MVTLSDIANHIEARGERQSSGRLDAAVGAFGSSVTHDSRRVMPGGIFVAIMGAQSDGNSFVGEATKRGASAIISEQPRPADFKGVWLQVADARIALAKASALVHDYPSSKLVLVGLTGTNGKTTTAHLVDSIFTAAGNKTALMGTIAYRIGDETVDAQFTTPESPEIQNFLRRAVETGVSHATMEVSSIALEMHRADELQFAAAAFTNLTQDHLDFHGSMENYFASKKKLFDGSISAVGKRPAHSIINLDDQRGAELKEVCGESALSYALDVEADISTKEKHFGLDGLRFTAQTPIGKIEIASPLVGRPHAYNSLCAIGVGVALGFDRDIIAAGINQCKGVAGRFERVSTTGDGGDDITVVVDYAHTPDALANVLNTVQIAQAPKNGKRGKIITVMGCGGDRDRTKRPVMGEVAAKQSDWVIATSDNPRSENPVMILNDIRIGLDRVGKNYEMIVDRREAIFRAVSQAKPGDVVIIAGKGHETYQVLATGKIDFDDREVAREALAERRNSRPLY